MKTAFIYSDEFEKFVYTESHPLKPVRLKLTYELAKSYGLFRSFHHRLLKATPCTIDDLVSVHSVEYIEAIERAADELPEWEIARYGLNTPDNPIFPQMFEWSLLSVGASLEALRLVESGDAEIAFNIAGGMHHAFRNRASGFCYFNDAAVVIQSLLDKGYRVAYIDIDAHHGDGVQEMFYRTDQVLTISLHESGQYLFPWSGFEREIGLGGGEGYAVNIPMLPGSDDDVFWYAFHECVPMLVERFQPDVLVTQLGVDTLRHDPLASLNITTHGFCRVVHELKHLSPGKWIALGGGGYNVFNVPRAWTLAWAIMSDAEISNSFPRHYQKVLKKVIGAEQQPLEDQKKLRDPLFQIDLETKIHLLIELEKTISYIKNRQLKLIVH